MDDQLRDLSDELLHGLRRSLTPDQGFEAFECHQLLAIRFHRAARINAPDEGERAGWFRFFREHFPRGDEHASLLWERWRIALLKDAYPGPGVAIAHGQAHGHWHVVEPGAQLYVNLESFWDDYEQSVASMVALLARDASRRADSLGWWSARRWTVRRVQVPPPWAGATAASASYTGSWTTIEE